MIVRPAMRADMQAIFLMGFDAWGDGQPEEAYFASCSASPKYRKGQWYVLEEDGDVKSSLILYTKHFELPVGVVGIGSVATAPSCRRQGYASKLIEGVIASLTSGIALRGFFLYSDVAPEIYERLGFVRLPKDQQRYEMAIGMIKPIGCALTDLLGNDFKVPSYF